MIYFIGFEASSLGELGFPIEIAWADQSGKTETYLIRPTDEWLTFAKTEWSAVNQGIHGISLTKLMDEGVSCEKVAKRVGQVFGSKEVFVYCDAPLLNNCWLEMLLAAGAEPRTVRLLDVQRSYGLACHPLYDLLPLEDRSGWGGAKERLWNIASDIIIDAEDDEALRPRVHHRALSKVDNLWGMWWSIRDGVDRRMAEER